MIRSIDLDLLGHGEGPVKTYEVIYYKNQIPKDCGGMTCVITAIPTPDTPLTKDKNGTAA